MRQEASACKADDENVSSNFSPHTQLFMSEKSAFIGSNYLYILQIVECLRRHGLK